MVVCQWRRNRHYLRQKHQAKISAMLQRLLAWLAWSLHTSMGQLLEAQWACGRGYWSTPAPQSYRSLVPSKVSSSHSLFRWARPWGSLVRGFWCFLKITNLADPGWNSSPRRPRTRPSRRVELCADSVRPETQQFSWLWSPGRHLQARTWSARWQKPDSWRSQARGSLWPVLRTLSPCLPEQACCLADWQPCCKLRRIKGTRRS